MLRLKNEEAHRERIAEEAVRLERAKREETHRRLRHRLVENTKRWELAQRLRAFIQATCNAGGDISDHTRQQTALWVTWTTAQANMLDPLYPDTSSVTSLTASIESWFNGYAWRHHWPSAMMPCAWPWLASSAGSSASEPNFRVCVRASRLVSSNQKPSMRQQLHEYPPAISLTLTLAGA